MEIAAIVDAITMNRAEFARYFLRAQSENEDSGQRIEFETLVTSITDTKSAFFAGLTFAQQQGFLPLFLKLAADSTLETGAIAASLLTDMAVNGNAGLQAMSNPASGFTIPSKKAVGILNGSRWTGRVDIGNSAKGSGVLIGPNLFMTAWHVVMSLFDATFDASGQMAYTPKKFVHPNCSNLKVIFDDTMQLNGRHRNISVIDAHQDWYVMHSVCHPDELSNRIPDPRQGLDGFWDYAIIRLAEPCGFERRWVTLDKRYVVPPHDSTMTLFQHPGGLDLKMDENKIKDCQPPDSAIPYLRFLHTVNSLNGSSGGPCFDKNFYLIGIHQGRWPEKIDQADINRAIPIVNIIDHYSRELNGALPVPDPKECPIFRTSGNDLVVGCDIFVNTIWEMALNGINRLMQITGGEGTGKSFLIEVFKTLMPDADHLKVIMDSEQLRELDAVSLAEFICETAGADMPVIEPQKASHTSPAAWLKGEVVPKIISSLDKVRGKRIVWLAITNMNKASLLDPVASDLLFILYTQVLKHDWLRVLLDGTTSDLSVPLQGQFERVITDPIKKEDIENCLRRLFSEADSRDGLAALNGLSNYSYNRYQKKIITNPKAGLTELADDLKELVVSFNNSIR